jgi:Glycine zipper
MKRILGAIMLCLVLLAGAAGPALAKSPQRGRRAVAQRRYDDSRRVYDPRYRDDERYREDERSVWERSRDKITVAGGAGAGAIVGGLVGGKKGAIIGALVGAGGSALYTYKMRDRDDDDWRRR